VPDQDAVLVSQPAPHIPPSLRQQTMKTYVRARFTIAADGSSTVELMGSSGNSQLDAMTLDVLRQWRWRPAIRDGHPAESVQRVRVEFEVD
jgi:protein TonB